MKGTNGFYARVALSFARKIDTDLIAFVRNVVTLMTSNPLYPSPQPTLSAVTGSVNAFEARVHDAIDGGRIAIATRNAARVDLLALLRQLAAYVQGNCGADVLGIIGSGFDPVRAPAPAGALPPPQNARLSRTDASGELLLRFDRVANAVNYSIQTAAAADGPWEDWDLSTASRVMIDGLTPGTVLWARACANGSAGASDWSGPATAMAV